MAEQLGIRRLSETPQTTHGESSAVVMVGSFAPIHQGHFDAINAASSALEDRGIQIGSHVLTPNSSEYVANKLPEHHSTWTYERRIKAILDKKPHPHIPTYIDDLSGPAAEHRQINDYATFTLERCLGFVASRVYLVVGSDQLLSIESHLRNEENRAVCVLRPGNMEHVSERLEIPWIAEAIEAERFIVTERENMEHDISSTRIRDAFMGETA